MSHRNEEEFGPLPDLSIDDFEEPTPPHEFSAAYRTRKAALLSEYRAQCATASASSHATSESQPLQASVPSTPKAKRRFRWKAVALAAAAVLAAVPVVGYAVASNADFFTNAFGTGARESVQAHDVDVDDDVKPFTVTYPTREYVNIDVEEAERLLGDHLSTTPVEIMAGDHKITVLSAVRDDNSAVIHYTVSREGGVDALVFDQLSNEGKGAFISNDYPVYWGFASLGDPASSSGGTNGIGGTVIVNEERTTPDVVDCYEYAASLYPLSDDETIELQVQAREDGSAVESVSLPALTPLSGITFAASSGDTVSVSPLSLQIGGAFGKELGDDPYFDHIEIAFSDGTSYTVYDQATNLDNTSYVLGRGSVEEAQDAIVVFNRLVNPDSIERITIHGVDFTRS